MTSNTSHDGLAIAENSVETIFPSVPLPAFFPDGTRGVVKTVCPADLAACGVRGIVMNSYHLMSKPGQSTIKALGGLHAFSGWKGPIIVDSGGFQVFSLIRENSSLGEIRKNEIIFRHEGKKTVLTPEKCVQTGLGYGADVIMALDYCTHPSDPQKIQEEATHTTIRWGERCMEAFKVKPGNSKLFGIIQGGNDKKLRKECAEALVSMGYTNFGFGGWPLDEEGRLVEEILAYTSELMPTKSIKYAMGVGKPENIARCVNLGYNLFDCVIPTREARRGRLYVFNGESVTANNKFYFFHYILDEKHRRDKEPVSLHCDCYTCQNYSKGYLRHLASIGDSLAERLATIHNLRFYTMLMERLKG